MAVQSVHSSFFKPANQQSRLVSAANTLSHLPCREERDPHSCISKQTWDMIVDHISIHHCYNVFFTFFNINQSHISWFSNLSVTASVVVSFCLIDSDVAAMCQTYTLSRRKTQHPEELLAIFCSLVRETLREYPPRLIKAHPYHRVSTCTLPSPSSTFLILSQNWLYCQ